MAGTYAVWRGFEQSYEDGCRSDHRAVKEPKS